jgi:2-polyprenyl-3-methyl-5-hydroxy-6-metoxy-1,4-benzoquinol methylase
MDKAGTAYWDQLWARQKPNPIVNPAKRGVSNTVNRRFHEYFRRAFHGTNTTGLRLLEVGCGNSGWLPYFAKSFQFKVSGIDYSEVGCEMERRILAAHTVDGEIIKADMFAPPSELPGSFDVVVSFGVVEHFEDTAKAVSACAQFAKPGGLVITNIPNMTGLVGVAQKLLNRRVFDAHVPVDAKRLSDAHQRSGCEVIECDYFMGTNFSVCNVSGTNSALKRHAYVTLGRLSKAVWLLGDIPPSKVLSGHINCAARKH